MQAHLNDAELTESLASGAGMAHLAECNRCQAELDAVAGIAGVLRGQLAVDHLSPAFWVRQRAGIRARIADRPASLRWAIAGMAAVVALSCGLLTISARHPQRPSPQSAQVDSDDLLLKDIQHSIARRSPRALAPANVLVQEITYSQQAEVKEN